MSGTTMIIMVTMALGMFMSSSVASGIVVWKDPFDFFDNETDPPIVSAPIVEIPPAGSYTANQNCRKAKDAECGSLSGKEREECVKRVRTDCVKAGGLWNEEDIKKYEDEQAKLQSEAKTSQFSTTSFNKDHFKVVALKNGTEYRTCYPPSYDTQGQICWWLINAHGHDTFDEVRIGKNIGSIRVNEDRRDENKQYELTNQSQGEAKFHLSGGGDQFIWAKLKKSPLQSCEGYAEIDCNSMLGTSDYDLCKSTMKQRCETAAKAAFN